MEYLDAYLSIASKSPKTQMRDDYQEELNQLFYESTDWFTIKEETTFGSFIFSDIDVRINNVVAGRTGLPQGDDYKVILFKSMSHAVKVGYLYYFDNNYWVVINTTKTKALTPSATVKRCNNVLRWKDSSGAIYTEPCSIDYGIKENRDYSTAGSAVVNPSGMILVTAQLNSRTNKIKSPMKFLFGNANNWTAYRVMGAGVENINNVETTDNNSFGFVKLTMNADYVNEQTDDIVNGIADRYDNAYGIALSESSIDGNVSDSIQLYATVTMNGETVSRTVNWASSDEDVATVDSSGNVTFVDIGTCTITASLDGDTDVYDTCSVNVISAPAEQYQVLISPDTNYILEGDTQSYNVTLLYNSVAQPDTFTFSIVAGNIPTENYTFTTIDGNNFSVENIKRYSGEKLVVQCVSGANTRLYEIALKGAW